jgi:hypothetical protein
VRATREIRELTAEELEKVSGGKTPTPGGPLPLPYPNVQNVPLELGCRYGRHGIP